MMNYSYNDLKELVKNTLGLYDYNNFGNQNLISLGISSIQIMKIVYELHKIGIKVSFSQMMISPTLDDWWEIIKKKSIDIQIQTAIKQTKSYELTKLTDVQYSYWIGRNHDHVLGGVSCHAYFEIDCFRLDIKQLDTAWSKVLYHHPMLRSKFNNNGYQVICDRPYDERILIHDFSGCDRLGKNNKLIKIREDNSHRLLKTEEGQTTGLEISLLDKESSKLHFDIDLLAADLHSIGIIFNDLLAAYKGQNLSKLPENWSYLDFVKSSGNKNKDSEYETAKNYWKEQIKNLPDAPGLPYCKKPETIKDQKFKRFTYVLEKQKLDIIKYYSSKNKVTPAMVLLAAYIEIIDRFSTASEFLLNIPYFGRPLDIPNIENVVGDFTNILLMPVNSNSDCSFLERVIQVTNKFTEIMQYSAYSGIQVIRDIIQENPERRIIAPVVFSCDYGQPVISEAFQDELGKLSFISTQTPQVLLDFQIFEVSDGLMLSWDVVEEAFSKGTIESMFDSYIGVINWLIEDVNHWNTKADVIPDEYFTQRYQNLGQLDSIEPHCIHEYIFKNAELMPDKAALIEGTHGITVSYKELISRARKLAMLLRKNNVRAEDKVGVSLPRGIGQVISILAVHTAGACYVPINPNQPIKRKHSICSKARIRYVISDTDFNDEWPADTIIINIDDSDDETEIREVILNTAASAYTIFTSGTTGEPKGVEISHTSAWNTIHDVNKRCDINQHDIILAVSSLEFDLSVYDIFGLLSQGGTVILINDKESRDAPVWIDLINQYNVTVWNSVPFIFDMLLVAAKEKNTALPSLKAALLSGDWIGLDLIERLLNIAPHAYIFAMGGATEASIWSNFFSVKEPLPSNWSSVPYGMPLTGQIYRVVDAKGRDCPDYVSGELWIGGNGVAKGYLGDRELTLEKFVFDKGTKWYRTGDIGRFWKNGNIEFLGRQDNQVKLRGHRIELSEIEININKHDDVINSVVCVMDSKYNYLAAYIVTKNSHIDQKEMKEFLHSYLPGYMVPSIYYFSNKLPISQNGKVDRGKVKELFSKMADIVPNDKSEKPKGKIEEGISKIWREALNINKLSRNDDFFNIGGDSLKAITIISKMQNEKIVKGDLSIQVLFTASTIKTLAKEIEKINNEYDKNDMETETNTI